MESVGPILLPHAGHYLEVFGREARVAIELLGSAFGHAEAGDVHRAVLVERVRHVGHHLLADDAHCAVLEAALLDELLRSHYHRRRAVRCRAKHCTRGQLRGDHEC